LIRCPDAKEEKNLNEKILEVRELATSFHTERGWQKAIDGVTFDVYQGEILGIVGESGCGKSVTSQSIMRLYDERHLVRYSGQVILDGQSLMDLPFHKMQDVRGSKVSMIFQDALSSLNPVLTIGDQIGEPLRIHQHLSKKEAREKALEMLKLVGIPAPEKRLDQYPHELSGGMRQRTMIAIALACRPQLLIADEPTTALDVTIQAQIMDLIVQLNKQLHMGVMLITHDLAVVAQTCSRVIVMYLGQIVEETDVLTLFDHPMHPYTEGLMRSIPRMEGDRTQPLYMIPGTVPLLNQIPSGCRFAPRCAYATEQCRQNMPPLKQVGENHKVRCFHALADKRGEEKGE
jgi:peptide/nickel transport system ATP-binding protein